MNTEKQLDKVINLAKDTYLKSNYPIGALLIVDNNIEIEGQNKVVTENKSNLHAEIDIINKGTNYFGKNNKKMLFVTMEPCNNCAKALVEYGVDEVYYILEDPSWGGGNILKLAGIKTIQVKYKYEQYLDLVIEFMQKHGGYNEVLTQYISIKENGENIYQKELDIKINEKFINISTNLQDYNVRKIVYTNTISYLKNALFRAPENYHNKIFDGYSSDMERIIEFCQKKIFQNPFFKLNEDIIKDLHRTLFPAGFISKAKDINGKEFISMIPGEYRTIELYSKTNSNKDLYYKYSQVGIGMKEIIKKYNDSKKGIDDILLFMADYFIVHPFGDGNGRMIYILVDLLLLKNGFIPYYLGDLKQKDEILFYKILDLLYETRNLKYMYDFIERNKKLD